MVTAFPFSAPRFTAEQQSKERASLRDDEKDLIRKDLYGKGLEDQHPAETQSFVSTKLQEMQEALDNMEDKPALNEALETVPHLVDEESPRLAFLRCEHYNAEVRVLWQHGVHTPSCRVAYPRHFFAHLVLFVLSRLLFLFHARSLPPRGWCSIGGTVSCFLGPRGHSCP